MRVLSLGWGVQSWTVAAMVALEELPPIDFAVHADTTHEASGTYAHARKWTPWLGERGVKVYTVAEGRTEVVREDWGRGGVMIPAFTANAATGKPGQVRRQCTQDWKITPIRRLVRQHLGPGKPKPGAVESLQGISFDEFQRMRDSDVAYIVNRYPLVERRMTRADCITWLESRGLDVPPKSACVFCPYHSLKSWKYLKRAGGGDWEHAVGVDASIRARRPQHGPLFVHPARVPLPEAVRIPEDEGAHQMEFEAEQPCDGGHCFV